MKDDKTKESSKRTSSEMPSESTSRSGSEDSIGEGEKYINVLQDQLKKMNDEISVLAMEAIKHRKKIYRKTTNRPQNPDAVENAKMPDAPIVNDANMKDEKTGESSKGMSSGMSSKSSSKCGSKVSEEEREKRLKALQDQLEDLTKELTVIAAEEQKHRKKR